MITRPLTTNERAETPGFTHIVVLTADDLTQATNNTAQAFVPFALKINDIIGRVQDFVVTSFQNSADAAHNTTTRSLGDTASATQYTAAAEMNTNGTVVASKFSNTAVGPYTTASNFTITINSMAGKALLAVNRGVYVVLVQLLRGQLVVNACTPAPIAKT